MEVPCVKALLPQLEPSEAIVGTLINMKHVTAVLPGTALTAEARVIKIDRRSVHFTVTVADTAGDLAATGEIVAVHVVSVRERGFLL